MDQGFRRGFTAAEKTKLWDRWQRGELLKAIGARLVSRRRRFIFRCNPTMEFVHLRGVARGWRWRSRNARYTNRHDR
jgi:hypothetical protein